MAVSKRSTTPTDPLTGWTTTNPDGSTTLRLEEPVVLGPITVTELRVPKLRAKHLRALRDATLDDLLEVLAVASGQESAVIDDLGAADTWRAAALVGKGLEGGLAPGAA